MEQNIHEYSHASNILNPGYNTDRIFKDTAPYLLEYGDAREQVLKLGLDKT